MLPDWLLKDDNYIPKPDKDTFINKSIVSFLGILSGIRTQSNEKSDTVKFDASLKIISVILLVTLLSISKSFSFIIVINVSLLLLLSLMKVEIIIKVLRVGLIVAAFTLVLLIPSIIWGNIYSSIMLITKVFASVMAANLLSQTTSWASISGALKTFFVPDIFIFVLDITIKYILLLGEFSLNMLYSLKLRSVGRNKNKNNSLSGIAGTMFIKSKEMAEEMYSAMECRGFTGEYKARKKIKLKSCDFAFIAVNAAVILLFIYLER